MTTFQALIDAFMQSVTQYLPISWAFPESLKQHVLHWSFSTAEILFLVSMLGAIAFLVFFRFDWLGMISAFFRSLFNPLSLKTENRSLDQHTLLFLLLIFVPARILKHILGPNLAETENLLHPFYLAAVTALLAFGFQFSYRWNKRIHGLNHLKLIDGVWIGALSLLRVLPGVPYVGLLWIGFALTNYHFEAIFKYSMLAVGLDLCVEAIGGFETVGLMPAIEHVGALNAIALVVVSFMTYWIGLENLQKNLNEGTYKTFRYVSIALACFFVATYFLRS